LIQRVYDPEKTGKQENMPIFNDTKINQEPINKSLNHSQRLGQDEQFAAIQAICKRATEGSQKKPRQAIEETNDAQQERGASQMPDEPALRYVLHEIAGIRQQRADNQKPEISILKRPPGLQF
jgi:hypothetical protein